MPVSLKNGEIFTFGGKRVCMVFLKNGDIIITAGTTSNANTVRIPSGEFGSVTQVQREHDEVETSDETKKRSNAGGNIIEFRNNSGAPIGLIDCNSPRTAAGISRRIFQKLCEKEVKGVDSFFDPDPSKKVVPRKGKKAPAATTSSSSSDGKKKKSKKPATAPAPAASSDDESDLSD